MNFYDKIHELSRALKETEDYKKYIELINEPPVTAIAVRHLPP